MVLLLSFGFFGSVRQLMNATHSALAGVSAADKVEKLLAIDTTRPYDPTLPVEKEPYPGIRMEHVSFGYQAGRPLRDVTLEIPKGKVTALVGLSGSGKSTIASLLMRFHDWEKGRILLEGRDLVSLTPEELRRRVILVPQTVSLYSGTIRENLRMAAPNATEEELLEALGQVRLKEWVLSQPEGWTLCGGRRGKTFWGPAAEDGHCPGVLCRAEYILFDEATSSVDRDSEQEIWNCIGELAQTRTLLIISHRLSTIRDADVIYVLEKGQVSQRGSHRELMAQPGLYRRLVEEQAQLEQQGEEECCHG